MDFGPLIVIAVRLLVPLLIFRFRFWGYVAALAADGLDVVLIDAINLGDFANYHQLDKLLDIYFLSIALLVSLKWEQLQKKASILLFGWRLAGVAIFELTQARWVLLIFPNLFGFFYLFEAGRLRYFPRFTMTTKRLLLVLTILLVPKLLQEYLLHFLQLTPWNSLQEFFRSKF